MPLSAILLTGKRPSSTMAPGPAYHQPSDVQPTSLACVEIFGQSVLQRTVARLQMAGVRSISIITTPECINFRQTKNVRIVITEKLADRWCAAERILKQDARQGSDTVLIAELGSYVEADISRALQFHRAKAQPITSFHDNHGSLCYWMVDAKQILASGRFPFPLDEDEMANPPMPYLVDGYVNRLSSARDFRQLIVDAFMGRCSIRPGGREIKPGVWIEQGANVHKTARLVAPVYVGFNTRINAGAVLTRFSNLEHDCNVGEGSLVAESSVLPHTNIGRGLDVSGAFVDGNDFFHLNRNVALRFEDPNLISDAAPQRVYVPPYLPEYEESVRPSDQLELEYSRYLSRAAGRLLEVFKGEV